jgi:alkanesulfonate monooxygenase SsuD/methylene tetrahydromethanopterin reductase-like flavin-dependent oxidoreductase (luciferase family)
LRRIRRSPPPGRGDGIFLYSGRMTRVSISYDMRAPDFAAPAVALYGAALDQSEWADGVGFHRVGISEHHASPDGYMPSPLVMASAVGARTKRVRISISLLLLPFYHPHRLAEDAAVCDLICGGRLDLMVGAGYREEEFDMYGVDIHSRGKMMEDGIKFLQQAWLGEPFEFDGRTVQVLPRPAQRPRPKIIVGGASPASARRAARLGDGYSPIAPRLHEIYLEELARLGKEVPADGSPTVSGVTSSIVAVSEDPDRTWAAIEKNLLHDAVVYAGWTGGRKGAMFAPIATAEELRATDQYRVVTPEACIELARASGELTLRPLVGGIDPDLAWESLMLFGDRVLPHLELDPDPA